MVRKLNKMRDQKGFTLIELMIVIAIIGILAAIAVPAFTEYREKGCNSSAVSDLRNAATAQEAYFIDEGTYCNDTATLAGDPYRLYLSDNVVFNITLANTTNYSMEAYHTSGSESYILNGPSGSVSMK